MSSVQQLVRTQHTLYMGSANAVAYGSVRSYSDRRDVIG